MPDEEVAAEARPEAVIEAGAGPGPEPAPVAEEAPQSESTEVDAVDELFAELVEHVDDSEPDEIQAQSVAETPAPTPAPAPPAPQPPQPPVEEVVVPATPAPVAEAEPIQQALNPAQLAEALKQLGIQVPDATAQAPGATAPEAVQPGQPAPEAARDRWVAALEEQYQLSDEDAQRFVDEPGKVVPHTLAQLHVSVAEQTAQAVIAQVPNMVRNIVSQVAVERKAHNSFFKAWPQLNDPKFEGTITTLGQLYRMRNPTASTEQFVRDVGAQAVTSLGLPLQPPGVMPAAQAAPGGGATVLEMQRAFQPAAPGGGTGPAVGLAQPGAEENLFAALADDDVDWL